MEATEIYKNYLRMIIDGYINSVLCYSKAGLGKTYTTIQTLKQLEAQYVYTNGVSTAVSLYKILYDNNDKIIVIDDIETIFEDNRIVNLLKGALWDVDGKRIVSYQSSAKTLEEYPDSFEFTGRVIILANELQAKHDESFKALMSRTLKYELQYSFDEIIRISNKMIDARSDIDDEQKHMCKWIISNNIKPSHNFNFRLLERLVSFVKYDDGSAEELFMKSLDTDDEIELIYSIIQKYKKVEDQCKEYMEVTGRSRMTFYRRKRKLIDEGLI